ncbi:HAD family hydrolase [Photorhabdus heterorhabditis]|uniref:HAD family phosphatase n=1 Tax=Photorhabdus heterorhabditis TaxID=880156 RepID=A0A5B0W502_9GAMM|nr:HAD family phosphatase [Photorhabdus heterorhabditis]KAA1182093.1 HAD family phosphatase [Photorhabdus heterorhabditis]KOY62534.1 hydrolase [Photorhabdus heterorhabditis]MBS9443761.1 HAD family phosphatase [Photorhabdus heterorhabditis]
MDRFNVIFDIDGVIVDSEQLHFDVLCDLAPDYTKHVQPQQLIGLSLAETLDYIGVPAQQQKAITTQIVAVYKDKLSLSYLRPGISELISVLQQHNIPFGFVSTAPREVCQANIGLLELHESPALISGDDVVRTKPHPDPYLAMLKLKSMDVHQTLVIEDTDLGITAATQAGIPYVYAWPHALSVAEQYQQATRVIGALTDIPQFSKINLA